MVERTENVDISYSLDVDSTRSLIEDCVFNPVKPCRRLPAIV